MSDSIQDFELIGTLDQSTMAQAAYVVASRSRDVEDARELLDALGLSTSPPQVGTKKKQSTALLTNKWD